jgi:hypothetical protein
VSVKKCALFEPQASLRILAKAASFLANFVAAGIFVSFVARQKKARGSDHRGSEKKKSPAQPD